MKILHVSTSDAYGGAAQAAYRLHCLLREGGHQSVMAVRQRLTRDPDVKPIGACSLRKAPRAAVRERLGNRLLGGRRVRAKPYCYFNPDLAPIPDFDAFDQALPGTPDMLFLHWVTGFVTIADIERLVSRWQCPLVWMLMDMEPITGGCHYAGGCEQYRLRCACCPQLETHATWVKRVWQGKAENLERVAPIWLAPTEWLRVCVQRSALGGGGQSQLVPLPISSAMQPSAGGRNVARRILGLPNDKMMIMSGVHNLKETRKGVACFIQALQHLKALLNKNTASVGIDPENVAILLVGKQGRDLITQIPFSVYDLGYLSSPVELSLSYQAANVYVSPSLEDGGPMMVSQAMLCGTPVVAYDTGIARELLSDRTCGYVAQLGNAVDLSKGIVSVLSRAEDAGRKARMRAVAHHSPERILRELEHAFAVARTACNHRKSGI